ncbi:hypothetical protein SAMN05444266_102277 [Chitinophaga jiangningensis]|uniref:Uncharacterized protein n=1 Tax=Chitinophaga jiangningensis TaxID=1419482 RepID=A0A1M6YE53_9BACT|nr:hypothetical protein [Chitinophaga jiangningensis]SHL16571.1 hypothetical protein SAMN05444266_102277 [Chitinophaga jiangningensis]
MSTVKDLAAACPYCGSHDLIRAIPETNPAAVIIVCNHCQKVVPNSPSPFHTQAQQKKAINDQVVDLCLSHGRIHGIQYYLTEMKKLGSDKISLAHAKQEVDNLLATRGLTHAIKKPNKNGCVIVLIALLLIAASLVYFFSR